MMVEFPFTVNMFMLACFLFINACIVGTRHTFNVKKYQ